MLPETRDDRQMRALTGVPTEKMAVLESAFATALKEEKDRVYQEHLERGTRRRKQGGGRKSKLLTVYDKLIFLLYYLKEYPTFDALGAQFTMNRSKACENIHALYPIPCKALSNLGVLPHREFKNGLYYIVVNRGKAGFTVDDTCDMISIRKNENCTIEVKKFEQENETYLLCRSTGRKDKDQAIRSRQEDLFIERLEYYKSGLGKKGRMNSCDILNEKVGRLREKYPRASKLYDVEVVEDEIKKGKAASIEWKKRDKYDAEIGLEGCYVLRTDRNNLSEQEIWET